MEIHFRSNLVARKYEVQYALQYFTKSAATWWKMHQAIQGCNGAKTWEQFKMTLLRSRLIQKPYGNKMKKPCACKICGEIGHTHEEHKDGCPHCEGNHQAEECPTMKVTCFLCEGTTHYPAQCHIYPKVQEITKQQKEAVKEDLGESLRKPVMKEDVDDPDGESLNRFYSNACYSCGEEGHFSQYCTKESQEYLGNFPTEEVEFDRQEIEELIGTKKSRKRKSMYPQNNPIFAEKDLSQITCYRCKDLGHYTSKCPARKPRTQGAKITTRKPLDLSEVICLRCKGVGHFVRECSDPRKA